MGTLFSWQFCGKRGPVHWFQFQVFTELLLIYSQFIIETLDVQTTLSCGGVWVLPNPESYAGGSVATGRGTHAGQVKG
jgi:hypothetical protein